MAKATKRKPLKVVNYSYVDMISSEPMTCFLCGAKIPPWTRHTCKKLEPTK
jgi:hypothetical protein